MEESTRILQEMMEGEKASVVGDKLYIRPKAIANLDRTLGLVPD